MGNVIIYTIAYNAEKTIARTIESVLSQTHRDFTYYIVDNGSLDTTGAIIKAYAARDERITAFINAVNHVWEPGNSTSDIIAKYDDSNFFCVLDADDEYKPDFLEKALKFTLENQLDIAACGNDFVNAVTGVTFGVRALEQDLILDGESFGTQFPVYHEFMRTWWGKLYSLPVMRDHEVDNPEGIWYGSDTLFAQGAFRRAKRVGVLAGSLHRYYVNPQSLSYAIIDATRVRGDRVLFDATKEFLMTKVGHVSKQNEHFLYSVYLNAIKDTLQLLMTAKIPDSEKMEHVKYLKVEMDEIQRFFAAYSQLT